jgi:hypothetical protein
MEAILAQRFSFCDFPNVIGFPNPILSKVEWEGILPTFKGKDWEVLAEHLLYFHEFIHGCQIVHEDVKIKLFRYSLKGAALDWCRSLLASSINSLEIFVILSMYFIKKHFQLKVFLKIVVMYLRSIFSKNYSFHLFAMMEIILLRKI